MYVRKHVLCGLCLHLFFVIMSLIRCIEIIFLPLVDVRGMVYCILRAFPLLLSFIFCQTDVQVRYSRASSHIFPALLKTPVFVADGSPRRQLL